MGLFGFGTASSTLFWPGCFSSALAKKQVENYEKILKKLKIKVSLAADNTCCSGMLLNAGYDKEARKLARENFEILKELKIDKIIANCPLCFKTLKQDYPEMVLEWDVHVEHILQTIYNRLKEISYAFEGMKQGKVLYHDSCYLGRHSGIFDQPRELLKIFGYEVIELAHSREDAICCGTCGGLKQTNPDLAGKIAGDFIKQINKTGIKKIVTADPQAYLHLKERMQGTGIEVIEISEILCDALEIWRFKVR